ncbi:hypothetical protein AKJ16_DCAP20287 [Drosera capensis]
MLQSLIRHSKLDLNLVLVIVLDMFSVAALQQSILEPHSHFSQGSLLSSDVDALMPYGLYKLASFVTEEEYFIDLDTMLNSIFVVSDISLKICA